jgi:hypothetical protein
MKMKVTEFKATGDQVMISLEPEHPAEVALFQLLAGCDAKFESEVTNPENGAVITATVKKDASRYR